MDSLARDGMRFTRYYVASPVCTPSRYNALAGRYASRSLRQQKSFPPGGPINIGWEAGVVGEKILPQMLQASGYVTGLSGKWHIGLHEEPREVPFDADPNDPAIKFVLRENYENAVKSVQNCGFDTVASLYGLNPGSGKNPPKTFWIPKALQHHNMEWVTQGAVQFIDANKDRPFFLYVAPTLPHAPSAIESLKSDPRTTPLGYIDAPPRLGPSREDILARAEREKLDAKQVAAVWLDEHVGVVLRRLDELGIADNTVVFLASDNGRNGKFASYDGGARAVMLARWKGVTPVGSVADKLASNVDLAPTILDICGIHPPADYQMDGVSFLPMLKGDAGYRRESVFLEITTERAVVTDDGFKYIAVRFPPDIQKEVDRGRKYAHWGQPIAESNTMGADKDYPGYFDPDQLYDLKADPGEQKNLAREPAHRDRLQTMKKLLRDYSSRLPHQFGEFTRTAD
jgi:arylsulfatase A-like enzyme